jgi:hypothetical protein
MRVQELIGITCIDIGDGGMGTLPEVNEFAFRLQPRS